MRQGFDWKMGAGCVSLLAMLALSTPGVRVVRADDAVAEASAAVADPGPICQDKPVIYPRAIRIQLPRTAAARQAPDSLPVALNNRGYSYSSSAAERPAIRPERR